jgi:hypothetical protein
VSASLRRAEYAIGAPDRPGLPPGVYEARATLPAPGLVRLDTAAFVGLAERGPLNTPVAIENFAAFTRIFGAAQPGLILPQAVRAFFAEGGGRCLVLRCLDHRNARTARFVLPGLAVAAAAPARRVVRIAARNPGAWGNRLTLRLAAKRRALPLTRDFTVERPPGEPARITRRWLAPAHRALPGTTLRLPGTVMGVPGWHLAHVAAVEPAGRGAARLTLAPEPPAGFRRAASAEGAEEITLSLAVLLDGAVAERWEEAALHHAHPRFLPRLIGRRAASEALLPPPVDGSDPETVAASPDLLWGGVEDPPGSELLRPSALLAEAWLLPAPALLAAPEGLAAFGADLAPARQGRDAGATMRRTHFLDPAAISPAHLAGDADHRFLVFANRPGALDALAQWERRNPLAPAVLIAFPDLLHPTPPAAAAPDPLPEPGAPCFGACIPPPAIRTRIAEPWPLLGTDLDDLRATQARIVLDCEAHGGRIALLDLPPGLTPGAIAQWRRALASDRAALYAPWLLAPDARDAAAAAVPLPPAATAAGIVARVERAGGAVGGPWAAPANARVASGFALAADPGLPDAGFLHEERVNAIRATERGLMLMGARTTSLDRDWTHLSVRRLMDWLKLQLEQDLAFAVFEPNGPVLRDALEAAAERRLRAAFEAGALAGRNAAEAFFARCESPRAEGQVMLLVGVAPAVPAEFLVFRLVRAGVGLPLEAAA